MIRVLLADDSQVVADILKGILETDPGIRVVGRARDGSEAIELVRRLKPDLLIMDVRMPVMDGIEATRAIMAEVPVPILIVSASVGEDTNTAFRAIQAGAIDVVAKPDGMLLSDYARLDLIRHARIVAKVMPIRRRSHVSAPLGEARVAGPATRVVAVGASTGGPVALAAVLGALGPEVPCPILVVQHIARGFLDGFVEWLGSVVKLPVAIAARGEAARAGTIWFPPEDHHLGLGRDGRFTLSQDPPRDGHRPSVDALFESVAESCGSRAVGVLLTGMGKDGAQGLKRLRDEGARTIAQDEATCVVFGMPRAAIELGSAERVLPLDAIAGALAAAMRR